MARLRHKKGPIETLCDEVSSGVWQFETGYYIWQYREGMGMNLSAKGRDQSDDEFRPALYAKNLDHAVMFAQGYEAGAAKHRHPALEKK